MPRRGEDDGVSLPGPIRSRWSYRADNPDTTTGAPTKREFESEIYRWSPRLRVDRFEDFDSAGEYADTIEPFVINSSSVATDVGKALVSVTASQVSVAEITVPRGGVIDTIDFVNTGTTLTANDTNFVTFAATNLLAGGAGSTALLLATAANTTQATGGFAWTSGVPFTAGLSAVAGALRVAEGDVIKITATVTGTLAAQVTGPFVRLRIRGLPGGTVRSRTTRTAGSPGNAVVANTANGEVSSALSATSEVQFSGLDWSDQLMIPGTKRWHFSWYGKLNTTLLANESAIWGLQTAYNSTLASVTKFARFRLSGSNALTFETKDGTTTNTAGALNRGGITLVAGTYYLFTIEQKASGVVRFFVNDALLATAPMAALAATDLFQPTVGVHKTSGSGVTNMSTDYLRVSWNRT